MCFIPNLKFFTISLGDCQNLQWWLGLVWLWCQNLSVSQKESTAWHRLQPKCQGEMRKMQFMQSEWHNSNCVPQLYDVFFILCGGFCNWVRERFWHHSVTSECTALLGQRSGFGGVLDSGFSSCATPTYYCRSEYFYSQCPQVWNLIGTEHSLIRGEHRVKN